MKSLLYSFAILLMLMPSLACAMPSCSSEDATEKIQPCANSHSEHHKSRETKKESGKVNLLLDCMGVDLQTADAESVEEPKIEETPVKFDIVIDLISNPHMLFEGSTIRGPPPDNPHISRSKPSLILTTQRFRI